MDSLLFQIENLVRDAAKLILEAKSESLGIEEKGSVANIVTKYDKLVQETLQKGLLELVPGASFIGEEDDQQDENKEAEYTFVVDPIDGTTNFARDYHISAISVALLKGNDNYLSVCYNPYTDEMFTAQRDKGAYLNGRRIYVSEKHLSEGIFMTGSSPYFPELKKQSLEIMRRFSMLAVDFRRTGSAVVDLCSVASGKAELFFELVLQPWDYAAAKLVIEEAGGVVTDMHGKPVDCRTSTSMIASNATDDYRKYIEE
jgi:myo-inositol-1(or 4)-monophosphatase